MRKNQALEVRAAHFQLGYNQADQKTNVRVLDADVESRRWNPAAPHAKGISVKTNWSLGNDAFEGKS